MTKMPIFAWCWDSTRSSDTFCQCVNLLLNTHFIISQIYNNFHQAIPKLYQSQIIFGCQKRTFWCDIVVARDIVIICPHVLTCKTHDFIFWAWHELCGTISQSFDKISSWNSHHQRVIWFSTPPPIFIALTSLLATWWTWERDRVGESECDKTPRTSRTPTRVGRRSSAEKYADFWPARRRRTCT